MIDQLGIAAFGWTAIWLSQDEREGRRRYACLLGIAAQPFWYYTAWYAQQWGILLVCAPYTAAWAKGVYLNWIKGRRKPSGAT